jgi:hypothetical protein
MLGAVPVTRGRWIYLPWMWALRFGHDGWLKPKISWLWEFRNGLMNERAEFEAARKREHKTREWADKAYQGMHKSGEYPSGLPLSPAEVYEAGVAIALQQQAIRCAYPVRFKESTIQDSDTTPASV